MSGLTKFQKNVLNNAREEAAAIRKRLESLTPASLEKMEHWSLGTSVTNLVYDIEKAMKGRG